MRTLLVALFAFSLSFSVRSQVLNDITGRVLTQTAVPLTGATVINESRINPLTNKNFVTITSSTGQFTIKGLVGDDLHIVYVGFHEADVNVNKLILDDINLQTSSKELNEVVVASLAVSSKSVWVGAKLGYNFDGIGDDNFFVGAAKVEINPLKSKRFSNAPASPYFSIIGSISNFINNSSKDSVQQKLSSLALSTQGVGVGLGALWEFPFEAGEAGTMFFRPYITSGYRLNSFTKIGKDSVTVNLSQFRTTAGLELEGLEFKNGGALNLSIEGAFSLFDPDRYQTVFSNRKKSLSTLEVSIILPISKTLGFFADGTYSRQLSAVYLIGIIVKTP